MNFGNPYVLKNNIFNTNHITHWATRCCGDIVATSLRTSQQLRRYVSNETPNKVLMECRKDVSVVRLQDVIMEHCDDVSRGSNNEVSSVCLQDISNKPQMIEPTTTQWYVTKTSQWYVTTTIH